MRNWVLGAAVAFAAAGLGTTAAQAAQFGFHVRVGGPSAYAPPCPGPGYVWVDGYMQEGYWVEGYWTLPAREYGPVVRYDRGYARDWDHDRWDRDRHWDRDGHRDRDRGWDHDRRWDNRGHEGYRR